MRFLDDLTGALRRVAIGVAVLLLALVLAGLLSSARAAPPPLTICPPGYHMTAPPHAHCAQ